jgi:hypothetical protein
MDIKVITVNKGEEPRLFGHSVLPERYQKPAQDIVLRYQELVTPYKPMTLADVAASIRDAHTSVDARVDADLLDEFRMLGHDALTGAGDVRYRLDSFMMP